MTVDRTALGLLGTAALVVGAIGIDASVAARAATWCAQYQGGSSNCGFSTQAQCLATVSGAGGMCVPMGGNETPKTRARVKPEKTARPKPEKRAPEQKAAEPAPPKAAPTPPAAVVTPQPAAVATPAARLSPAGQHNFQTARAFILSGKYEEAISALKAVGNDDHPDVASALGYANARLGRAADARAWYAKALAADPDHLATLNYSGALHVQQGEMTEARNDLARIEAICRGTTCREYKELQTLIAAKQ